MPSERSIGSDRVTVRFKRPTPTSGSGAIAIVRLKAVAGGSGAIRLQSLEVGNGENKQQSVPAEIKVTVRAGSEEEE